jgi:shikimate dehydrogenase
MKLAAVIGWPVAHSLSPTIHTAAFTSLGLAWTYTPISIRPGALDEGRGLLDTLGVDAASVTMPHKEGVVAWCAQRSDLVDRLRAVNTLTRRGDGGWAGDNTDVEGFARFLAEDAKLTPSRTLIVGAGGAARAVAVALADAGTDVVVTARRAAAADAIVALAPERTVTADWGQAVTCDLIVQTTPVLTDELPGVYRSFPDGRAAVELAYALGPSAFLDAARAVGAPAFDGLGMLLRQAAASFRIWTGQDPPLEVMRDAAEAELARRRR